MREASSIPLSWGTSTQIHPQVECDVLIYQDSMIVTPQTASQHEICGPVPSYLVFMQGTAVGKYGGFPPKIVQ